MKKTISIFIFMFILISMHSETKKEKIVVLNFKNVNVDKGIADAVSENLVTTIIDLQVYQVIERAQLNKIFGELKLTSEEDFDDATAIEVGKLAKAKIIIIGSVTKLGRKLTINARGIEVETGNAIFGKNITTPSEDDLPEAIKELARIICLKKEVQYDHKERDNEKDRPEFEEKKHHELEECMFIREINEDSTANYNIEILQVFPFIHPDGIDAKVESIMPVSPDKAREVINVGSFVKIKKKKGNVINWDYFFEFKKPINLMGEGKTPRIHAEAGIEFRKIRVPEKLRKNSGFYIKMASNKPGQYSIELVGKKWTAVRSIYLNEHMDEYFIPFDSFIFFKNEKKTRDLLSPSKIDQQIKILILKPMRTLLNSVGFDSKRYEVNCKIEEAGFYVYDLKKEDGVISNFNNHIEKTKANIFARKWGFGKDRKSNIKLQRSNIFTLHNIEYGISDEHALDFAKSYFLLRAHFSVGGDIVRLGNDANFGIDINFNLKENISQYKAVSFLMRGQGFRAFTCVLTSFDHRLRYHQTVPLSNEWVRIVIPFDEFMIEDKKVKPKLNLIQRLNFVIHKWGLKREPIRNEELAGDYNIEFYIDEIKFIK